MTQEEIRKTLPGHTLCKSWQGRTQFAGPITKVDADGGDRIAAFADTGQGRIIERLWLDECERLLHGRTVTIDIDMQIRLWLDDLQDETEETDG